MSEIMKACWHCDVCGFEWLKGDSTPTHCASSKCRSRRWNHVKAAEVVSAARDAGLSMVETRDIFNPTMDEVMTSLAFHRKKKEVYEANGMHEQNPHADRLIALSLKKDAHDPKTCRIYRCGLCAIAKG